MTTEPPEVPERGRRSGRLLGRLGGRIEAWHVGFVAGILAAVIVGGYLWVSGDDARAPTVPAPEDETARRGVACPYLYEAFMRTEAGDVQAFRRSVDAAARVGEQALEQSGQVFGRPEEIAIELQNLITEQPDGFLAERTRYLDQARRSCERIGSWPETG